MELAPQKRKTLVEALGKGRIPYVLEQLAGSEATSKDKAQITLLQSQHNRLQQQRIAGLVSQQDAQLRENRITANLLQLLTNAGVSEAAREFTKTNKKVSLWQYLVALGLFIGIVSGFLTLFSYPWQSLFAPSHGSITILVHGPKGRDQLVLPGRGEVRLIYGDAIVSKTINKEGEATFKQVPGVFFEQDAQVEVHFSDPGGEPYRAVHFDSLYAMNPGKYLAVQVALQHLEVLKGQVHNFKTNEPIEGVRISSNGIENY